MRHKSKHANFRHGHNCRGSKPSRTYTSWQQMWERCRNPQSSIFKNYGGRGITVCDRWRVFENFLADLGERPDGKTLDRYPNNDGNYEPGNCRWATYKEQANNRRPPKPRATFRPIQSNNKSGYSGVYWKKDTQAWVATFYQNRKRIYLGKFPTAEAAAEARKIAREEVAHA